MFRLTPYRLSFYSPYLRNVMKLQPEIKTDKDYYMQSIGNPLATNMVYQLKLRKMEVLIIRQLAILILTLIIYII